MGEDFTGPEEVTYITFRSKSKNIYLRIEYNRSFRSGITTIDKIIQNHITNWIQYFHNPIKDLEITVQKDSMKDV